MGDAPGHSSPKAKVAISSLTIEPLQCSHGDSSELAIIVATRSRVTNHHCAAVHESISVVLNVRSQTQQRLEGRCHSQAASEDELPTAAAVRNKAPKGGGRDACQDAQKANHPNLATIQAIMRIDENRETSEKTVIPKLVENQIESYNFEVSFQDKYRCSTSFMQLKRKKRQKKLAEMPKNAGL